MAIFCVGGLKFGHFYVCVARRNVAWASKMGNYWPIFMLTKVLRATREMGNIHLYKNASSDTNVGQYSI